MRRHFRTILSLALHTLGESRWRAAYLVVTLAVAVAAWLALAAMATPFTGSGGEEAGVTISNGNQGNATLPLSYGKRIANISGARDVTWTALQVVKCGTSSHFVTLNAYGGPGTQHDLVVQQHIDAQTVHHWASDPLGVVISDRTAKDCGWSLGQGVAPPTVMGGKQLELHISGIFQARGDHGDVGFAHFDYINRTGSMFGKDQVIQYSAQATSPRNDELLAARIEAEFAHDFPTVSATTNATVQNAWARYGKIQQLLAFVMAAILLCAASVLVSVLAHAAAQRRAKFALLQVLGFRRGTLFGALALEVLVIVILGALVGVGVGKLVAHFVAPTTFGLFSGGFAIPGWAYAWMPAWLFLLLAASLAWPAALVARVRASDYRAI